MWGKFGQRPNKTQCAHFTNPQDFHDFLESDKYVIQKIQLLPDHKDPTKTNEDAVDVFYTMRDEDQEINGKCNIFIAAFTTCWAHLKLYKELERGQQQIVYYDTDSIMLIVDENNAEHYHPETGDYLGELTNELYDQKRSTAILLNSLQQAPKIMVTYKMMAKKNVKLKALTSMLKDPSS